MNRDGVRKSFYAMSVFLFCCMVPGGLFAADGPIGKTDGVGDKAFALHDQQNQPLVTLENKQKANCPQKRTTLSAPESYSRMKNPLQATRNNLLAGQTLFLVDAKPTPCQACHGMTGNGLGVVQMSPAPRNFACFETMKDVSDGQLFWIIQNGSLDTKMPAYKNLEEDQIWQLILYLRHFTE